MNNNEIERRMDQIIHRTALANSDHDFMATHMPFKKLKYSSGLNLDKLKEELTEETFLEKYIFPGREKHKMVFIKGNAGSGKSHLIRWFYTMYKNRVDAQEELTILISRDSNSLKGTLKQIVESELFEGFQNEIEFKKLIEAGDSLEKDKLREDIPALLVSSIRSSGMDRRYKDKLANFLDADIIREKVLFREKGPIDRIIEGMIGSESADKHDLEPRFYPDDFNGVNTDILRMMRDTESDMGASRRAINMAEDIERNPQEKVKVANLLNDFIDEVIQKIIQIGFSDLQEVFKKIRKRLKKENMNLTIFFEDITTTRGIHKELLEVLIVNHNENKKLCRIISFVGITENYYSSYIQDNVRGRVTDGIDIEETSLISNKKDLSKFIGLYMNAINQEEEGIINWYTSGGLMQNLPLSKLNMDKPWSKTEILSNGQVSIYPFTENALWNLYNSMDESGKEPRGFLSIIINNLYYNYLYKKDDYIFDMDLYVDMKIPPLREVTDKNVIFKHSNDDAIKSNKIESIIRIWGDGTIINRKLDGIRTIGGVKEDIFKHYGLPIIQGGISEEIDRIDSFQKSSGEKTNDKEPIENAVTDRKEIEYKKNMEQLEEWRKGGKLFEHRKYRDSIVRIYKNYINWEEEGISKYLLDGVLGAVLINIEGQGVSHSQGILLERSDELYYFLVGLVNWEYLGGKSWEFKSSHVYLGYIFAYLDKHKNEILEIIKKPQSDTWEFEDILIINSYYSKVLNHKITSDLKIEEIYKKVLINISDIRTGQNDYGMFRDWDALQAIYNRSSDMEKNQELLVKYFNLPQGRADFKTSGAIEIYAYKVLQSIKKINDEDWDFKQYNINPDKTIEIYRPLHFFKAEVYKKIPELMHKEIGKFNKLIISLEKKHGEKLDHDVIRNMRKNINIYLDLVGESNLINNKHDYDSVIFKDDKEMFEIYSFSDNIKSYSIIECLLVLSRFKKEILILEQYNRELSRLENDIDQYNNNTKERLKRLSNDDILYKDLELETRKIMNNIIDVSKEILGVI